MRRRNPKRERREARAAELAALDDEGGSPPPRWFNAVFFTGAFAITAAFASSAVFTGTVQPLVAPLVYHSTDGVVIGYGQVWTGLNWGGVNGLAASYEVEGQTFRAIGSRNVEPAAWRGDSVRVYYPAARPDRGFVCDWAGERRWRVTTWPLAAFCLPFLTGALFWYWLSAIVRQGSSSLVRTVCLPFGSWFAGVFLGGAVGVLLVSDPKDMDHPVPAFLLQIVGGTVGGWWGLRRVGAPTARSPEGKTDE